MINIDFNILLGYLKYIGSYFLGYFSAKKAVKMENLEKQNEELKKNAEIDASEIERKDIYDSKKWAN